MELFYNDKKFNNLSIYLPNNVDPGHMGWYFHLDKLKIAEYTDRYPSALSKSGKHFKNSGVMNLIPYLLELNLMNTWCSQIKKTHVRKQLDSTRSIVHEVWDLPFPLSQREGNMYFQYINLIKE